MMNRSQREGITYLVAWRIKQFVRWPETEWFDVWTGKYPDPAGYDLTEQVFKTRQDVYGWFELLVHLTMPLKEEGVNDRGETTHR